PPAPPSHLPSFPTRRSSDLACEPTQRFLPRSQSSRPAGSKGNSISGGSGLREVLNRTGREPGMAAPLATTGHGKDVQRVGGVERSEEHTSELQSRENLVCRL